VTLWEAILLGAVQGVTEFLPVSSSGHLVIMHHLLGVREGALTFDAVIHLGSLAAILWAFRRDLALMARGVLGASGEDGQAGRRLALLVGLATLPLAVLGFLGRGLVEQAFSSLWVTPVMLYATGALLLLAERLARRTPAATELTWRRALGVGLAQVLALLPGLSRSGATIAAGMALGLPRELAARFSFLLAIPALLGASLLELRHAVREASGTGGLELVAGTLAAGVTTYWAVVLFLRFVRRGSLAPFAYYTWALATAVLAVAATGALAPD
jgi:undecaprenyl-diphosphatase